MSAKNLKLIKATTAFTILQCLLFGDVVVVSKDGKDVRWFTKDEWKWDSESLESFSLS